MNKVLILGGYGNFGKRIAESLVKKNIPIVISGRNLDEASRFVEQLQKKYPRGQIEIAILDIKNESEFEKHLINIKPFVVIHTCGPFQNNNYSVAELCIKHKIHYVDLADGRDFVNNITTLNQSATENNVLVVSGASTVPCLSSAVLQHYKYEFLSLDQLVFGITLGQKIERGLATTKSILSYVGKLLQPYAGHQKSYGWQNLYRQSFPVLGTRWMATCDIPDLDLLPKQFGLKSIQFSAGIESTIIHLGLWILSWLIRLGIPINLLKHAESLFKFSHSFDKFGTDKSGMHMTISGKNINGNDQKINWFIIAKQGDGPHIPTIPAIILTKKLLSNVISHRGAIPCVNLITLEEYLAELKHLDIHVYSEK